MTTLTLSKFHRIATQLRAIERNHGHIAALSAVLADDGTSPSRLQHFLDVVHMQVAALAAGLDVQCGNGSTFSARRDAAIAAMAIIGEE